MKYLTLPVLVVVLLLTVLLPLGTDSGGSSKVPSTLLEMDAGTPVTERVHIASRSWTRVTFEGGVQVPGEGRPALPMVSHPLVLDRRVEDIRLVRSDPRPVPIDAPVLPSSGLYRSGMPPDPGSAEPIPYDMGSVYDGEDLAWAYMGSSWENGREMHHYSILASPFHYDPAMGSLVHFGRMELALYDSPTVMPMSVASRSVQTPSTLLEGTRLLIVSASSLTSAMDEYRQWNQRKGVLTTLVSFDAVDSAYPGMDGPSSLWQYVHDSYFGDGSTLEALLLVGEVETVPSRMVKDLNPFDGEPSTLPADTYFACLGDESSTPRVWNTDNDANWGEMGGDISDHIADIHVGRIALSDASKARSWVKKVIDYESAPADGTWSGKAALFGADTHEYYDGANQCEYLWDDHLSGTYPTKAPYYSEGHYSSTPLTYNAARSGFANGFSLVVYMGHGLVNIWSEGLQGESDYLFGAGDARDLSQGTKLPFITAMSCETNWFDHPSTDSISEAFTEDDNGGAIAYVGASRTTYGGIGYDEYYPGAPGVQEDILRMLSRDDLGRVTGAVFTGAKNYYAQAWGAYFQAGYNSEIAFNAWMEHNLLGPVNTPLWIGPPSLMAVTYDYDQDYYTNFTVTVKETSGDPVQGATVTVYTPETDRMSAAETDASGVAMVPFVIDGIMLSHLTVTSQGHKAYTADIWLEDTTKPSTRAVTSGNPDGVYDWYLSDPQLRLVSSEAGETFYKWNGGNRLTYQGTLQTPPGDNNITFWSVDLAGNTESAKTFRVKYDPDMPVMHHAVDPPRPDGINGWYNTVPMISVILDPSYGSGQWVEYWWDRGGRTRSNGTIYAPDGEHTLHFQALDLSGRYSEEVELDFKLDSKAPATTLSTGGAEPNGIGWFTSPFTISMKVDDRESTTRYRWDEDPWSVYKTSFEPLEGEHTLHYRSEDPYGNVEEERSQTIRYDPISPVTVFTVNPPTPNGENGYYKTRPTVYLSADEDAEVRYRLEGGAEKVYEISLQLEDGSHEIEAYSVDRAGNVGNTITVRLAVDTEPDKVDVTIQSQPVEGWYKQLPSITMASSTGTVIYYYWEDISTPTRYNGNFHAPVEEGTLSLVYYSIDRAGNKGQELRMGMSVDTRAPQASLNCSTSSRPGRPVAFDMTGSSDGIAVSSYWIDFGDGSDPGWVSTPLVQHVYVKEGSYDVKARVRDQAGHESQVLSVRIEVEEESDVLVYLIVAAVFLVIVASLVLAVVIISHRRHEAHHAAHAPHPPGHPRPVVHPHQQTAPHPHHRPIPPHHPLPQAPSPVRVHHQPPQHKATTPHAHPSGLPPRIDVDHHHRPPARTQAPPPPGHPHVPSPPVSPLSSSK